MKKIYLLLVILSSAFLYSCSSGDNENPTEVITPEESGKVFLAKDSIHYYEIIRGEKNKIIKHRRSDNSVLWSSFVTDITPFDVDMGYGKIENITTFNLIGFIDNDNYICYLSDGRNASNQCYSTIISIYNQINGTFIKNHIFKYPNSYSLDYIIRWYNGKLLFGFRDNSYVMLDNNGDIERTGKIETSIEGEKPFCLDNNRCLFVSNSSDCIKMLVLDGKVTELFDLKDYYKKQYPDETQDINIIATIKSVENNILTVDISLLFYSGNKKNDTLKINIENGELVN